MRRVQRGRVRGDQVAPFQGVRLKQSALAVGRSAHEVKRVLLPVRERLRLVIGKLLDKGPATVVCANRNAADGEGFAAAELDLDEQARIRSDLPALDNRRRELFEGLGRRAPGQSGGAA